MFQKSRNFQKRADYIPRKAIRVEEIQQTSLLKGVDVKLKLKMKKVILLVSALSLLAIGFSSVSCKKAWKGCKCSVVVDGITLISTDITAEMAKENGISNCKDLQAQIAGDDEIEGASYKCTDL